MGNACRGRRTHVLQHVGWVGNNVIRHGFRAAIVILALFNHVILAQSAMSPPAGDDMRLLIDISGSMKQNDPHNLRVEAAQLWLNVLEEGTPASVWLFAEKTAPLIQSDAVDANWKKHATQASHKIHARGLYTDIEGAVKTLLEPANAKGQRQAIMLSDGRVDIDPDIMVSADSRERVLSEWLPKLKEQHIRLHTIALSDQADQALLQTLAVETGGWFERAESADQLQRLFLKLSQRAAPRDRLPLKDNRFQVDNSVKEFSVVVFKQPHAPPTRLIAPNQSIIDKPNASVAWLSASTYDLITIKQPQAGEWRIEAASDPDNQVMILTDLKLELDDWPHSIEQQQSLMLKAHLSEHGQAITREDFLHLLSMTLTQDQQTPVVMPAAPEQPGFFTLSLSALTPGQHELTLRADGQTFQREKQLTLEVIESSHVPSDAEHAPTVATEEQHDDLPTQAEPHAEPEVHEDQITLDWTGVVGIVLAINLALGVGAWWLYKAMTRANHNRQRQLLERL